MKVTRTCEHGTLSLEEEDRDISISGRKECAKRMIETVRCPYCEALMRHPEVAPIQLMRRGQRCHLCGAWVPEGMGAAHMCAGEQTT